MEVKSSYICCLCISDLFSSYTLILFWICIKLQYKFLLKLSLYKSGCNLKNH